MSEEKGFEVNDKRKASGEGASEGPEAKATETHADTGKAGTGGPADGVAPSMDFISFAGSLGATALMYMGERLSPEQPEGQKDLNGARQMIDILDILKEKTKGNLDKEESDMFNNMIYNLKMRYVHETTRK